MVAVCAHRQGARAAAARRREYRADLSRQRRGATEGYLLRQPELAVTLERLAHRGAEVFTAGRSRRRS